MVIIVLTFAIMGESNINSGRYYNDIHSTMNEDITEFKLKDQSGEFETSRNEIYFQVYTIFYKTEGPTSFYASSVDEKRLLAYCTFDINVLLIRCENKNYRNWLMKNKYKIN